MDQLPNELCGHSPDRSYVGKGLLYTCYFINKQYNACMDVNGAFVKIKCASRSPTHLRKKKKGENKAGIILD